MIVGSGLIASLFANIDNENIIFFASGVSNSSETDPQQFLREENLIRETILGNKDKLFLYFSTCSIYDSSKMNSPYVLHKHKMEEIIMQEMMYFLILRISNAVGNGGNPNLLMNYLVRSLKKGEKITIHEKATRNLIDVEDIKKITQNLIENKMRNSIINIAYPTNYNIKNLVDIIENYFNKKTDHTFLNAGSDYGINISETENYFVENHLLDKEEYIINILRKYYS
ncbi:NAD-dependent epimerase/dehydratase family protein [Chryseobacterium sp.]|uniref:NAD-dependent epimerase/dehydratase family protein n=1 Tax=Chryseobacterium sp. TaxID=1871047 RepID=UPI00388D4D2E